MQDWIVWGLTIYGTMVAFRLMVTLGEIRERLKEQAQTQCETLDLLRHMSRDLHHTANHTERAVRDKYEADYEKNGDIFSSLLDQPKAP